MSFTITNAFVNQFGDNIILLSQQERSRFSDATTMKRDLTGEAATFERLAPTEAQDRTSRHSDSPLISSDHTRRWATAKTKEWGDLIDRDDEKRMLISPGSTYAMNGVMALERVKDTEIISALQGTAKTGKDGTGTQVLPAAQKIAAASAGLTLGKIIEASKKFNNKEIPQEDRFWGYGSEQLEDLLNDQTITSADFNTVRLLMMAQIDTFMGFKWIRSERLTKTGSNRQNLAWQRRGIGFGVWQDNQSRVTERPDKSFSLYVYLWNVIGAVRIEDEAVVQVDCQE